MDTPAHDDKPESFHRIMFIASLAALFGALALWMAVFIKPFKVVYEQLGMTERPWITELAMAASTALYFVLPASAAVLLVTGIVVLKRGKRKTMIRLVAINWIITALMPGFVYFVVYAPLIELQKKLGSGS